jgi:hypothetical protein
VVAAWSGGAQAQPVAGVEVRWAAPPPCPDGDDVLARVRRLLGADTVEAPQKDRLIAEGTVVAIKGHYRLRLIVRPEKQPVGVPRVFDSESCESLAGAAAVTLALLARGETRTDEANPSSPPDALRPSRLAPGATSAPASASAQRAPSPPAVTPPPTLPAPESTPPSEPAWVRRGWAPTLQFPLLAMNEGNLPSLGYGLGVAAGIRVSHWQVTLAGVLWETQSSTYTSLYEASYTRRSGEVAGCYAFRKGPFEAGPCITIGLEDVSAAGSGPEIVGGPGHATWLTLGLAARAEWSPFGWAALFLQPSVTLTTSRPVFAIDSVGTLYQVPLAAVGVQIGCEWIL